MTATYDPGPRLGIYINNRAAVFLGPAFDLHSLVTLARTAEEAGFDFVSVGDSVLAKPRFAPIVTLAAVAGVTHRIGLTTGILQPHLRNIVLLAQEWATLDVASGGRTSLGVGLGTGPRELVNAELALAGLTRKNRARAFVESIAVLKRLWEGGPVTFDGDVYKLTETDIGYTPAQAGGPPIVVACGAFVPREPGYGPNDMYSPETAGRFVGPVERVGRLGDGWVTGMATVEEWRRMWEEIVAAGDAAGRTLDRPDFERRLNCFIHIGDEKKARAEGKAFLESYHRLPMDDETVDRWLIAGSPQACAEQILAYAEAGVNSFQLVLAAERQEEQLGRLAERVRPLVGDHAARHKAGASA